ncbi:MAG: hypothetical protein Q9227_005467 [Pyrenula ochraceoflavens]
MSAHLNLGRLRHYLRYHAQPKQPPVQSIVINVSEETARKGMELSPAADGKVALHVRHEEVLREDAERTLSLRPSVLERKCIAWEFKEPEEKTSTLAVTSPGGYFVDIRFDLAPQVGELQSYPAHRKLTYWAFAGIVESTPVDKIPYTSHAKWTHTIDTALETLSDQDFNKNHSDEGDLFLLHNSNLIEVGSMDNPELGREAAYKEHWQPQDLRLGPQEAVVVKAENLEILVKGLIIRIGGYCQGLVHDGVNGKIHAERWILNSANGEWHRQDQFETDESKGDADKEASKLLPCKWACEKRVLGDKAEIDHLIWEVIEASSGEDFLKKQR